jgi:hypothetical protein
MSEQDDDDDDDRRVPWHGIHSVPELPPKWAKAAPRTLDAMAPPSNGLFGEAPAPGLIGLTEIGGEVGRLIHLGQYLAETPMDRWLRRNDLPRYEHALVALDTEGTCIEAEPGGAEIVNVSKYPSVYWCYGIASKFTAYELTGVADAAREFEGVGYAFLDYEALALHRLHVPAPGLKGFIEDQGHVICSQLADASYERRDLHVFNDGRWPGYVMPMDLYLEDHRLRQATAASRQ